jgi:hypothetical protein
MRFAIDGINLLIGHKLISDWLNGWFCCVVWGALFELLGDEK